MEPSDWQCLLDHQSAGDDPVRRWARLEAKSPSAEHDLYAAHGRHRRQTRDAMLLASLVLSLIGSALKCCREEPRTTPDSPLAVETVTAARESQWAGPTRLP